jgi:hypothetical protein
LGSLGVINHGAQDPWIFKYSAAGVLLWKRQIGTPAHDGAGGVATDQQGNVYIAGTTVGSLAGPHRGADDAFIVKYLQRP